MLDSEKSFGPDGSIDIAEAANTDVTRLAFKLRLTDANDVPLAGREVNVEIDGDGSFAINFSSKEIKRVTDDAGEAVVAWFRRGIYGRKIRGTISGSPGNGEGSLAWELTDDSDAGTVVGYTPDDVRITRTSEGYRRTN